MNLHNFFNQGKNKNKDQKPDKNSIIIKDGKIPYDKIEKEDKVSFIVITQDMKVLEKTLKAITDIKKQYENKEFTVFISSSYETMHRLSGGAI